MTEKFSPLELSFWVPIFVSLMCGTIVGLERQLRGKPLDVRTAVLICMGTHVFVRLAVAVSGDHADTMRVMGQMVTGIGFLGAGVILTRGSHVTGLTTAAVIWALASIGAAIGFAKYGAAIALSIVVLIVLTILEGVENRMASMRRGAHARVNEERKL